MAPPRKSTTKTSSKKATPKEKAKAPTKAKKAAAKAKTPAKAKAKKTAARAKALQTLEAWAAGTATEPASVVAALAQPDPAVDTWLSDETNSLALRRMLDDDHVWGLRNALDEGPRVPAARWLRLAATDPERFVWATAPEHVLPFEKTKERQQLEALLSPVIRGNDMAIGLSWLRHEAFLAPDEAVAVLEHKLDIVEQGGGWLSACEALQALSARGAQWTAARRLEGLMEAMLVDSDEASTVERAALVCIDGPLLAALARTPPWRGSARRLTKLVNATKTEDLLSNFGEAEVPTWLKLKREDARLLQGIAWKALASRTDSGALDTCARLIAETAEDSDRMELGVEVAGILMTTHEERAVADLACVFLSGLHHAPVGEAIERYLLRFPAQALEATLGLLPDWMPGFDQGAFERLAYRLLPKLDEDQVEDVKVWAEVAEGARLAVIRDELALLGR